MSEIVKKKIVMLGDFGVGKTSLVRRFVENMFSDTYLSTIGVKISKKNVLIETDKQYDMTMLIWDIAGKDGLNDVNDQYLQGAHGGIIVADITRDYTMKDLTDFFKMIESVAVKSVIAINKVDLVQDDAQKIKIENEIKKQFPIPFFFTSAKDGSNVENLFKKLAELLII